MLSNIVTILSGILRDKKGQAMVEYGIIIALIAAVLIATVGLIGDELLLAFEDVLNGLTGVTP